MTGMPPQAGEAAAKTVVHVMRHGEVHNPDGILYGRLLGYGLSERGRAMADRLAQDGDAAIAGAGTEAAQALAEAETQLAADTADTTILPAAAARVELAGLQVR